MGLRIGKLGHIDNIGERGARRRRLSGVVWLVIALAGWILIVVRRLPSTWAFALVVPFTLAAVGWLQAREKT